MRTWNARDAKRRRSLPLCAAPARGGGPEWKNFWHRLGGKTEMTVQTKAPESQFADVVLAAKRARQIMAGETPRHAKPQKNEAQRVWRADEEDQQIGLEMIGPFPKHDGKGGKNQRA